MAKKIDEQKAKKWVKKFKEKDPRVVISVMIPRNVVQDLLNQPNCEGIRVYNAYNEGDPETSSGYTMIVLGTDGTGKNLLPSDSSSYSIWDDNNACPPNCPPNDL